MVEAHAKADAVFDGIEARYPQLIVRFDALAEEIDRPPLSRTSRPTKPNGSVHESTPCVRSNHIEESNRLVPKQNAAADETTRLQARIVLLTNDHNARSGRSTTWSSGRTS